MKDLNQLRRDAIDDFEMKKLSLNRDIDIKEPVYNVTNSSKTKISILVRNVDQLNAALANNVDYIYVTDFDVYQKYKKYDNVYYMLKRVNEEYKDLIDERLLATEYGSLIKYSSNNDVRTDYGFNVANDYTISCLEKNHARGITLSLELELNDLLMIKNKANTEILVYGKPLCMIIKNDILNVTKDKAYLLNDKNQKYPVLFDDGFTYVYNDKNIDLLDKIDKLKGFGTFRIDLFDENISETSKIINIIRKVK